MLIDTNPRDLTSPSCHTSHFAPIGIKKLYTSLGELVLAKIAGELALPCCLFTAGSQPIEAVARANDEAAASRNELNEVRSCDGLNDVEPSSSRLKKWLRGLDARDRYAAAQLEAYRSQHCYLCVLLQGNRKQHLLLTDVNVTSHVRPGNEIAESNPVFMKKYGEDLKKQKGKWIDSHI
ncbi:hypothetical protein SISSUDRAFT_1067372 [Sistotremastrum suecicum HHB10207 ss-3]|uniref:Uncharacterized protein n=1 Tax=Sistotremastrum suecicum HHB10207 ss-3 TaxID=1314776 RepID=A0A165X771_9AGAM|nr:hypothetical protein SISSUDRAFT_1067372 [Sistotremastrum suecicum HHB10207 ss-3]